MAKATDGNAIEITVKTMWGILIRTALSRGRPISITKSSFLIFASNKEGHILARQMHIDQKQYTDMGMTVAITRSLKVLGAM
eukprot:3447686-Pyramimonas_sp.AAC.2